MNYFKDKLKPIILLAKLVVFASSIAFLYYHLFVKNDHLVFFNEIKNSFATYNNLLIYVFVFILMGINWFTESLKWKILSASLNKLSIYDSFKSVLAGVALSTFTPSRIGELGGRVLYYKKDLISGGLYLAGFGSFMQLACTILFGIASFGLMSFYQTIHLPPYLFYALLGLILLLLLGGVFWRDFLEFTTKKWPNFKLEKVSKSLFQKVLLLSIVRYGIFTFQFYLLLILFNVELSFFEAISSIPLTFLGVTIIPSFAIADFGIRGAVSTFFIGFFSANIQGIISASLALWVINIVIPSLLGNLILFKTKFVK